MRTIDPAKEPIRDPDGWVKDEPWGSLDILDEVGSEDDDEPMYIVNHNRRLGYIGLQEVARDAEGNRLYEKLFFAQGEEADEYLDMLDEYGAEAVVSYLISAGVG